MSAPNNVRPFRFRDLGEPLTLEDVVFQTIGAASVCWEHVNQAGPFEPDKAHEIAEALLTFIRGRIAELLATGLPELVGTVDDLRHALHDHTLPLAPWDRVALYRVP